MAGERTLVRVFLDSNGEIHWAIMTKGLGKPLAMTLQGVLSILHIQHAQLLIDADEAVDMSDDEVDKTRKLLDT